MLDARAVTRLVDEAHRRHWATVVAATARVTRDLDLAEDCAQDAYVQALRSWPDGVPESTVAWLTTVARRTALDRLRREATLRRKLPLLQVEPVQADDEPSASDPLRLVFTCCHPALSREAQLPLTLRLMCGLTTAEIARVLLIKETAVAARITRAKQKIAAAGVPFRLPDDTELPARLDTVLTVVHLAYTAGHTASGDSLTRPDLTGRAIELARLLVRQLPGEPEAQGLLALLLLAEARGEARVGPTGELVLLADQDRATWDRRLIAEGLGRATTALRHGDGRFALQAAIAGLHAAAPSWEATDWRQVVRMYDGLLRRWPNPVVALNRVAATSLVPGADLGVVLGELDRLAGDHALDDYAYLPATRAHVLARLGRRDEARAAYDEAILLTANETERRFLQRRRASI
ncbi:MAG: sigma-70 family RNA polymerase sigma factor [Propionibacteriales bacterium]|jgi:RNA polymerase sigma-70 factor (ECF subfamily)|nr:sigma-70 family RNA polymerase sigma factor [Propionibacteriales bacterium]